MGRSDDFVAGREPLSAQDASVLAFESRRYRFAGKKAQDISETFSDPETGRSWNESRYYQRLNQIIDNPAALSHDGERFAPMVNRLRRVRDQRLQARSAKGI